MRYFINGKEDTRLQEILGLNYTINYGDSIDPFAQRYSVNFTANPDNSEQQYVVELPEVPNIKNDFFICCIKPDGVVAFLKNLCVKNRNNGQTFITFEL